MGLMRRAFAAVALLLISLARTAAAQENFIIVASTTSTEQSGLFRHILPMFQEKPASRCVS